MNHFKLPGGDLLRHDQRSVVIEVRGPRKILSTSYLNGGYREDLRYLFNFCDVHGSKDERCEMRAPTNEGHLHLIALELGLDPAVTTGLSTAAHMRHIRPHSEYYHDFSVTAIATAGIDVNGSRVGDPACWHEQDGVPVLEEPGTINIFLLIDANLTKGAMARALVTCSEAKVAALQEVQAPSLYSNGLATGSGTDGAIVVCNSASPTRLTSAGHHSKLGEYIGRVVKETLKEALVAEDGPGKYTRGSALKRLRRFGVTEERLLEIYRGSRVGRQPDNLAKYSPDDPKKNNSLIVKDLNREAGNKAASNPDRSIGSTITSGGCQEQGGKVDVINFFRGKSKKIEPDSEQVELNETEFLARLKRLDSDSGFIARTTVFAHLLDLLQWNLVDSEEARRISKNIFRDLDETGSPPAIRSERQTGPDAPVNDMLISLTSWLSQTLK